MKNKTPTHNQTLGAAGEQVAQRVYIERGFEIVAENYVNPQGKRFGEIDFIAYRKGSLRFVEVKTRSSEKFGTAAEAITATKRRRLFKIIEFFLVKNTNFAGCTLHIDVVSVACDPVDNRPKRIRIYTDAIDRNAEV